MQATKNVAYSYYSVKKFVSPTKSANNHTYLDTVVMAQRLNKEANKFQSMTNALSSKKMSAASLLERPIAKKSRNIEMNRRERGKGWAIC